MLTHNTRTFAIILALCCAAPARADEAPDAISHRGGIVASEVHESPAYGDAQAVTIVASKPNAKCGGGWIDTCDADGNCVCLPEM